MSWGRSCCETLHDTLLVNHLDQFRVSNPRTLLDASATLNELIRRQSSQASPTRALSITPPRRNDGAWDPEKPRNFQLYGWSLQSRWQGPHAIGQETGTEAQLWLHANSRILLYGIGNLGGYFAVRWFRKPYKVKKHLAYHISEYLRPVCWMAVLRVFSGGTYSSGLDPSQSTRSYRNYLPWPLQQVASISMRSHWHLIKIFAHIPAVG